MIIDDDCAVNFETWNIVADRYQEYFMDVSQYASGYDSFINQLSGGDKPRVFEIGCGPGNITKYLLNQRPSMSVKAIDVAPAMVELTKRNNPMVEAEVLDCRMISNDEGNYDGVMCGFCMPYLSRHDCAKLIKDCSLMLTDKGVFYISVIEGEYTLSGYQRSSDNQYQMYVYYHDEYFLSDILKESGFSKVNTSRLKFSKRNGSKETHLVIVAQKE